VELVTLFSGLRAIFLRAKFLDSTTSTEDMLALWNRSDGTTEQEAIFPRTLAATCLVDADISAILETSTIPELSSCNEGRLSVIERLMIERNWA
jgi:hypothetical protein